MSSSSSSERAPPPERPAEQAHATDEDASSDSSSAEDDELNPEPAKPTAAPRANTDVKSSGKAPTTVAELLAERQRKLRAQGATKADMRADIAREFRFPDAGTRIRQRTQGDIIAATADWMLTDADDEVQQRIEAFREGLMSIAGFTKVKEQQAQVLLSWKNVSYFVDDVAGRLPPDARWYRRAWNRVYAMAPWRKKNQKQILHNVTGFVRPGEMVALMGPSGAGKSTLLDVLAARKTQGKVRGEKRIRFNGMLRPATFKRIAGYVEQKDVIGPGVLTVKQALGFTAKWRLSNKLSLKEKAKRCNEVIDDLRLNRCANTVIGSDLQRGISGGQAKRVNIAMELIPNPPLLFLDEPTSGLDSSTAFECMSVVRDIANEGHTVLCTIHQPSREVFALFDKALLLVEGHVVYFGPVDAAVDYFVEQFGFHYDPAVNPADFIISAVDTNPPAHALIGEQPVQDLQSLIDAYENSPLKAAVDTKVNEAMKREGEASRYTSFGELKYNQVQASDSEEEEEEEEEEDGAAGSSTEEEEERDEEATTDSDDDTEEEKKKRKKKKQQKAKEKEDDSEKQGDDNNGNVDDEDLDATELQEVNLDKKKKKKKKKKTKVSFNKEALLQEGGNKARRVGKATKRQGYNVHRMVSHARYPTNFFQRCFWLTGRHALVAIKTPSFWIPRVVDTVLIGLLLGSLFRHLEENIDSVLLRTNLMSFISLYFGIVAYLILPYMFEDRLLFYREHNSGTYDSLSQYIATTIVEIPFAFSSAIVFSCIVYYWIELNPGAEQFFYFMFIVISMLFMAVAFAQAAAALTPSIVFASALVPVVMACLIVVQGWIIRKDEIPDHYIWLHYISMFKYSYEGLLVNELEGQTYTCLDSSSDILGGFTCQANLEGDKALEYIIAEDYLNKYASFGIVIAFTAFYKTVHFLALYFIKWQKR